MNYAKLEKLSCLVHEEGSPFFDWMFEAQVTKAYIKELVAALKLFIRPRPATSVDVKHVFDLANTCEHDIRPLSDTERKTISEYLRDYGILFTEGAVYPWSLRELQTFVTFQPEEANSGNWERIKQTVDTLVAQKAAGLQDDKRKPIGFLWRSRESTSDYDWKFSPQISQLENWSEEYGEQSKTEFKYVYE